jgi:hypothetical protein
MSPIEPSHLDISKLHSFLDSRLPRKARRNLQSIVDAIVDEARKYNARIATKHLWSDYGARRRRLKMLSNASVVLARELLALDPIAKELLAPRLPLETLEKVKGHLLDIRFHADELLRQSPQRGRPPNVAEEIWVMAIADIFEVSFERKPSISQARGAFFELLKVARPFRMMREGDLDTRSLRRALKKREMYREGGIAVEAGAPTKTELPPRL